MADPILYFTQDPIQSEHIEMEYVIKNGSLFFEWAIYGEIDPSASARLKETKLISVFDLAFLNYSEDRKQIIIYGTFSRLHIDVDHFKNLTKAYFSKYNKESKYLKDKYLKPYSSISDKHKKLIQQNEKYRKVTELYRQGDLMFADDSTLTEDEDNFFSKLDYHRKGMGGKTINKTILKMLETFPRTSKEVTVWRAIRMEKPPKKGDVIRQSIVFSTSLNPYVSMDYMDRCCLFKIVLPPRYPAIYINKFLDLYDEVILGPSRLTVQKKYEVKKHEINKFLGDPIFPHLRTYGVDLKRTGKKIYVYDCAIESLS